MRLSKHAPAGLCLAAIVALSCSAKAANPPPSKDANIVFHASLADGLGFRTSQDEFVLDAGVLSQTRFDAIVNGKGLATDGFTVGMVRPYLRARAFHDTVRFFVQPELATATPKLLDLEITWQPLPELGMKIGQFLTPFSRAFFTPVPLLQFPDFARVNEAFRQGRDTGAMTFGTVGKGKLEYYLGAFNGNGIDKAGNDDTSIMGIARIAINPVRPVPYDETPLLRGNVPFGIMLGVNGIADRAHPTQQQKNPTTGETTTVNLPPETRLTAGADVFVAWNRFTFLGEAFARRIDRDQGASPYGYGAYAQTGFFLVPKRLEVAARVGMMDPDTTKGQNAERSFEGLVNGYVVGNHLKMNLRYMLLRTEAAAQDGSYAAGNNHKLTFQVQLWI